MLNIAYCI